MTLDSVAHLLPRMRSASTDTSFVADLDLDSVLAVMSTGGAATEPEDAEQPPVIVPGARHRTSSRTRTVSSALLALAASGVFFTGIGSVFMHNAMPMSAMMGKQSHRMADGSTMSNEPSNGVSTGMSNGVSNGAGMTKSTAPAAPGSAMQAAAPAADSGPPRPHGPGTAMSMPATSTTGTGATSSGGSSSGSSAARARSMAAPASSSSSSTSSTGSAAGYVVRTGDDFGAIGAKFGISPARVAALNPGVDPTQLSIGQTLRVR